MFSPGQKVRLRSSARSDTGKVRDNNEDRVFLSANDQLVMAIVADGMGGAVAGEEASRIAVEQIHEGLLDSGSDFPNGYREMDEETLAMKMRKAIIDANDSIVHEAQRHPELKGMGTTVTMAFIRNTHVVLGHVGDSRAYLIDGSNGEIVQITSDHSFVQALVTAGHISAEEAEEHPMRNVLYRALGQAHDVEVDIYYEKLRIGDRMVLCSDGLTLHVKPNEIAQIVLSSETPEEASQKLVEMANKRGGRDNVSAIVVKVDRDTTGDTQDLSKVAAKAEPFELDNEDTLILNRNPYRSSESARTPKEQERDSNPQVQNVVSQPAPTAPTIPVAADPQRITGEAEALIVHSSNESDSRSAGEGSDPHKNVQ